MKNLLIKEIRLSSNILSFLFILFGFMTLIPGYPILMGSFFVCLGIFQSFQGLRENSDILYTVLLPVDKADAVRAKYIFVCFIELMAFLLMAALTALRMTVLRGAAVYASNPMMNANLFYLGCAAFVFALFNTTFLEGFFRTAYKIGKPFVWFIVLSMLLILAAEILHHVPGLEVLNGVDRLGPQTVFLVISLAAYGSATAGSCARSMRNFERIDL